MATRLIQTLAFVDVPAGGTATLPHSLNIAGTPVTPDLIMLDTPGFTAVANTLEVGVQNVTLGTLSVNAWVERKHTIPRELGALSLAPSPFVVGASINPLATVDLDATRGVYVPGSLAQWNTVLSVAGISTGGPVATWPMQDVGPNLIDVIGAFDFVPAGAPLYQQPIAGWSRLAVALTESALNRFSVALAAGNTVSALMLFYVGITATPGGSRQVVEHPNVYAEVNATPTYQANGGTLVVGTVDPGTAIRPLWVRSNVTLTTEGVIVAGEVLTPTWSPNPGTTLTLGSSTSTGAAMVANYGSAFTGLDAELTNAELAAIETVLGF